MSDPVIRSAQAGDAAAIARVHVETWRHAYRDMLPAAYLAGLSVDQRRAMWQQAIETGHPTVYVAQDAAEGIAGFAAVAPSRDKTAAAGAYEIWAIYVAPAAWGRGIGRKLCEAARDLAQSHRAPFLSLWVIAANEPAKRFYATVGFVEEPGSRQSFELGGVTLDELRFVQPLGAGVTPV